MPISAFFRSPSHTELYFHFACVPLLMICICVFSSYACSNIFRASVPYRVIFAVFLFRFPIDQCRPPCLLSQALGCTQKHRRKLKVSLYISVETITSHRTSLFLFPWSPAPPPPPSRTSTYTHSYDLFRFMTGFWTDSNTRTNLRLTNTSHELSQILFALLFFSARGDRSMPPPQSGTREQKGKLKVSYISLYKPKLPRHTIYLSSLLAAVQAGRAELVARWCSGQQPGAKGNQSIGPFYWYVCRLTFHRDRRESGEDFR